MATLALGDEELKSVERIRNRLRQLSDSIESFQKLTHAATREGPNKLPPSSSIDGYARIIQSNLQTVLDTMSENQDLFSRIAVHPSTNFPGRTQENRLLQLLRKKLEPDVEEMVAQGQRTAQLLTPEGMDNLQQVWDEVHGWINGRIAEYVRDEAGDPYTKEEREAGVETVRTGLKRDLDEEEDEDDEDDDKPDAQTSTQDAPPRGSELETMLWAMAGGEPDILRFAEYSPNSGHMRGLDGVNIPSDSMMDGVPQPPSAS